MSRSAGFIVVGFLFASALCSATAFAHPGHGIAVSKGGDVYFADVARTTIWRYSKAGELSVAVADTWSHTLRLHEDGTLYFERELPVDGVAPAELNRLSPAGLRQTVIPAETDRSRFGGSGFLVMADASVLFPYTARGEDGKHRGFIGQRTKEGDVSIFAGAKAGALFVDGPKERATFRMITDMAMGKDGALYVIDRDRLRAIDKKGVTRTIAKGLLDEPPADPPQKVGPPTTINRLYGLAISDDGQFFIAYHSGRKVLRVSSDGKRETIYEAARPWTPVGVAVRDGQCIVLEANDDLRASGPRLRVIEHGKPARTLVTIDRANGK